MASSRSRRGLGFYCDLEERDDDEESECLEISTEAEGGHPIPNSNSHARTRNGPTSSKIAIII